MELESLLYRYQDHCLPLQEGMKGVFPSLQVPFERQEPDFTSQKSILPLPWMLEDPQGLEECFCVRFLPAPMIRTASCTNLLSEGLLLPCGMPRHQRDNLRS